MFLVLRMLKNCCKNPILAKVLLIKSYVSIVEVKLENILNIFLGHQIFKYEIKA